MKCKSRKLMLTFLCGITFAISLLLAEPASMQTGLKLVLDAKTGVMAPEGFKVEVIARNALLVGDLTVDNKGNVVFGQLVDCAVTGNLFTIAGNAPADTPAAPFAVFPRSQGIGQDKISPDFFSNAECVGDVFRIDPLKGTSTLFADIGTFAEGLAVRSNGSVYAGNNSFVVRITRGPTGNPGLVTSLTKFPGTVGPDGKFDSLTFDVVPNPRCNGGGDDDDDDGDDDDDDGDKMSASSISPQSGDDDDDDDDEGDNDDGDGEGDNDDDDDGEGDNDDDDDDGDCNNAGDGSVTGDLYVLIEGGSGRILKVNPDTGAFVFFSNYTNGGEALNVAPLTSSPATGARNVFASSGNVVTRISPDGKTQSTFAIVPGSTLGVAIDNSGVVYISSITNALIYRLTPPATAGVSMDIDPGRFPNKISIKSKGTIDVAILGSNAVVAAAIDRASVKFGATGKEASPVESKLEDVNRDGIADLKLKFRIPDARIVCGARSAMITAKTRSGQGMIGFDSIVTDCK